MSGADPRDPFDLQRFVDAQRATHDAAVRELRAGRKMGHWIWFVFPQVAGLGHSPMSRHYAISGLAEARAYLEHPVLGPRLHEAAGALLGVRGRTAREILGDVDAVKVRSSMTLFARAAPDDPIFRAVLDRFYAGEPDPLTEQLLGA